MEKLVTTPIKLKIILAVLCIARALHGAAAPAVFFTDITSGPSIAAAGAGGAFITVYGRNFGAARGSSTVTIGGAAVAEYATWSDSKVAVRLGPANAPGVDLPVVVTVGGTSSNADVVFTIRGNSTSRIFFLDPTSSTYPASGCSSTASNGSQAKPWGLQSSASPTLSTRTISYYMNQCLTAGDILYVTSGTIGTYDGNSWGAVLTARQSGSAGMPIAVVAYPGSTVTLDGVAAGAGRVSTVRWAGTRNHITLAGFRVVGNTGVSSNGIMVQGSHLRIVGNYVTGANTCQYGGIDFSYDTALQTGGENNKVLGNEVAGLATACNGGVGSSKLMHSIYVKGNNVEVAYNYIHGNKTYNGIQIHEDNEDKFHSNPGNRGFYNISFHDNRIEDQLGAAINLSTLNFPTGLEYVRIYNNVMVRNGTAIAAGGSGSDPHACISIKDIGNPATQGLIDIYNNTMADCSSYLNGASSNNAAAITKGSVSAGHRQPNVDVQLRNNIIFQPAYSFTSAQNSYVSGDSHISDVYGSHNMWFGDGSSVPSTASGWVGDPSFVSLASRDVRLLSTSTARRAGVAINSLAFDYNGMLRGHAVDLGALEYIGPGVLTLSGLALNSSNIHLSWTEQGESGWYIVERKTAGGTFQQMSQRPSGTTGWTQSGLQPGVTYVFRASGCGDTGCSDSPSNEVTIVTPAAPDLAASVHGTWMSGAVVRYSSPDARECTLTLVDEDNVASPQISQDGGGLKRRAFVFSGASAGAKYFFSANCGGARAEAEFTARQTLAAGPPLVQFHNLPPVFYRSVVDNILVTYGGQPGQLTQTAVLNAANNWTASVSPATEMVYYRLTMRNAANLPVLSAGSVLVAGRAPGD